MTDRRFPFPSVCVILIPDPAFAGTDSQARHCHSRLLKGFILPQKQSEKANMPDHKLLQARILL